MNESSAETHPGSESRRIALERRDALALLPDPGCRTLARRRPEDPVWTAPDAGRPPCRGDLRGEPGRGDHLGIHRAGPGAWPIGRQPARSLGCGRTQRGPAGPGGRADRRTPGDGPSGRHHRRRNRGRAWLGPGGIEDLFQGTSGPRSPTSPAATHGASPWRRPAWTHGARPYNAQRAMTTRQTRPRPASHRIPRRNPLPPVHRPDRRAVKASRPTIPDRREPRMAQETSRPSSAPWRRPCAGEPTPWRRPARRPKAHPMTAHPIPLAPPTRRRKIRPVTPRIALEREGAAD